MSNKVFQSSDTIVGVGGGTTVALIAASLHEGFLKTCLVIAAPLITVLLGKFSNFAMTAIDDALQDWKLMLASKALGREITALSSNPHTDPAVLEQAKSSFNELAKMRITQPLDRLKMQIKRNKPT